MRTNIYIDGFNLYYGALKDTPYKWLDLKALTGWPSIIAVILNYAKRSEVRGTWLDSHFGWQIRTFWYALLWLLAGGVAFVTLVGIPVALVVWILTGLWVLYRIARGWMTLSAQKPMPQQRY